MPRPLARPERAMFLQLAGSLLKSSFQAPRTHTEIGEFRRASERKNISHLRASATYGVERVLHMIIIHAKAVLTGFAAARLTILQLGRRKVALSI